MVNRVHFLIKLFSLYLGILLMMSCTVLPTPRPEQKTIPLPPRDRDPSHSVKPVTEPSRPPIKKPQIPAQKSQPALSSPVKKPIRTVKPLVPIAALPVSLVSLHHIRPVPGGVAWVSLPHQQLWPPQVRYRQRQVMVLHQDLQWMALVGIPLNAKLGQHAIEDQETGERYSFQVHSKKYKTQHIRLKNKRHVNPNARDLKRILKESRRIKAALATPWRATAVSPLPLTQPVQGRFSSSFGLRRYFNGKRRNPHKGLDIATPQGTPVIAAAAGQVINTGHYFYTGKTVIIDHGQSVVTLYGHLNSVTVQPHQTVQRGEQIGTIGRTGRATGPHLHWAVSLNNTFINPLLVTH